MRHLLVDLLVMEDGAEQCECDPGVRARDLGALVLPRTLYAPLGPGSGRCWISTRERATVAWPETTLHRTPAHVGHCGAVPPAVTREVKRWLHRIHRDGARREARQDG